MSKRTPEFGQLLARELLDWARFGMRAEGTLAEGLGCGKAHNHATLPLKIRERDPSVNPKTPVY